MNAAMTRISLGAALLLVPALAIADPTYTVTDLGSTYSLESDSTGNVYAVVGSGDTQFGVQGGTYAFDKTPVSYPAGFPSSLPANSPLSSQNLGWSDGTALDYNTQGQVVGTMLSGHGFDTAAFSNTGFTSFPISNPSLITWNQQVNSGDITTNGLPGNVFSPNDLGDLIGTPNGFGLTSAVAIDNLGRIIVTGSLVNAEWNAQENTYHPEQAFLLTPSDLGTPATIPEPASLAIFLAGIGALALRRRRS